MDGNEIDLKRLARDRNRVAFRGLILLGLAAGSLTAIFKIPGLIACVDEGECFPGLFSSDRNCIFDSEGKHYPDLNFTAIYNISGLVCEIYCMTESSLQKALPHKGSEPSSSSIGCIFGIVGISMISVILLMHGICSLVDSKNLTAEIKRKTPRPPAEEALLLRSPDLVPDLVIEMPPLGDKGPVAEPCGADIFK
jgi:hypothetical protein